MIAERRNTTTVTAANGVSVEILAWELAWTTEVRAVVVSVSVVHPTSGARYEISRRTRVRVGAETELPATIIKSLDDGEAWCGGKRGGRHFRMVPLRIIDPMLPAIAAAVTETADAIAEAVRL